MKFLKVIRFDGSDDHVFETAAAIDEWTISGAFEFSQLPEDAIKGKLRQAFANGFLGTDSFGRSTFAHVSDMSNDDENKVAIKLAQHFVDVYGAPSLEDAGIAAQSEMSFIQELCAKKPVNTVFTVRRILDEHGDIREEFREISPPSQTTSHTKIWEIVDEEA